MKKSPKGNQVATDNLNYDSDKIIELLEECTVLEKWVEVNKATIKEKQEQLYAFETKMIILRNQINRTHKIL